MKGSVARLGFLIIVTLIMCTSCSVDNQVKEDESTVNIQHDNSADGSSNNEEVKPDYGENIMNLISKADNGDIDAMNELAYYFFNGYGVEQDYQKSLDWSIKSAEGGNLASMFNVGYHYYHGFTGEVDYDIAFEWYDKAAQSMYPKALNALGHMYYEGLGVEKDVDKALEYTLQSAGFLHNYSLSNMGAIINEEKLDEDENHWYRLAAKNYLIQSGANRILYENLKNGEIDIAVDYSLEDTKIPKALVEDVLFKFYSGTLYDYLKESSQEFKDIDLDDYDIKVDPDRLITNIGRYDSAYLLDLNNDGKEEIITFIMEGTAGATSFNILEDVEGVYISTSDLQKFPMMVGINGLITFEDKKYFVVANVDTGDGAIERVNIYSFNGVELDESITINIEKIDTSFMKTYQKDKRYNKVNEIVEEHISKMFIEKYNSLYYENVNDTLTLDTDINNDGILEHYEYESIYRGTINRPISLEFTGSNSKKDLSIIDKALSFNDLGTPLGIEVFTVDGINYIGVLSYEFGTNNHCMTTFILENDMMTVVLNHLITFEERFIVN